MFCLGAEHTGSALEGADCPYWKCFTMRNLRSYLTLFDYKGNSISAPCCSSPASAEAARRLRSWGSQMELLEEPKMGPALSLALFFFFFFTDCEGPVLDVEACYGISSGLDVDLLSGESSFEELDVESGYDSNTTAGQYHTRSCSRSLLKWWSSSTTIGPVKGGRHPIANWMIASLPAVRPSHQKGTSLSFPIFTMKSQGHGNPHILPVSTIPQCFIHLSWD